MTIFIYGAIIKNTTTNQLNSIFVNRELNMANDEKLIIYPSIEHNYIFFIFGLIIFFLGSFLLFITTNGGTSSLSRNIMFYWLGLYLIAIGCSMIILSSVSIKYRNPRIVLTPQGIAYNSSIWKVHFYKWSDLGPFSVSHFQSSILLIALTDERYDLLVSRGEKANTHGRYHADVVISIQSFDQGKSIDTANEFSDQLNEWRERYGNPEVDEAYDPDALYSQFKDLQKQKNNRICCAPECHVNYILCC